MESDFIGIDGFLRLLEGVRKTGNGRWIARCPGRRDKTASLSIRVKEDGNILLHDFGGLGVGEILSAMGLKFINLIPPALRKSKAGYANADQSGFNPYDALRCLEEDATILAIIANKIADGSSLSSNDMALVKRAQQRIESATLAVKLK